MDIETWEKTILAWINLLTNSTPISSVNQINDSVIFTVIKRTKLDSHDSPVGFFRKAFPNLSDSLKLSSTRDYLCAATLLLIYVSFAKNDELEEIREIMCTELSSSMQANIVEFLSNVQSHCDIFNLTLDKVEQEIFSFVQLNSSQSLMMGDCLKTPVRNSNSANDSCDSPLQGFFQTPKKNQGNRNFKCIGMYGDGDHLKLIKKLTDQLLEEEFEKSSLQENLNAHLKKCNDYENKLKNKIEEIQHLKIEWEKESMEHENEVKSLKDDLLKNKEEEKKIKNEMLYLENCVSTLESDLADSKSENQKLECKLKDTLEKCSEYESQVKQANKRNRELQEQIMSTEKELISFKESYENFDKGESRFDFSFMTSPLNTSVHPSESMEVVIDKLLKESNEENSLLKESIEELKKEKDNLQNELELIKKHLESKDTKISELQSLNNELVAKTENLSSTQKELVKVKNDLLNLNEEFSDLLREKSSLSEKCNLLNNSIKELERAFLDCKTSKMLLHLNFLKLAEDFQSVLERLEDEVKQITKLSLDSEINFLKLKEKAESSSEMGNVKETLDTVLDQTQHFLKILQPKELSDFKINTSFSDNKYDKLKEFLQHFESNHHEWTEYKNLLQKICDQLNDNIIILKINVRELKVRHNKSLEEKIELEEHIKKMEKKIAEIERNHLSKIQDFNKGFEEKENKIRQLEDVISQSKKMHAHEKEDMKNQVMRHLTENKSYLKPEKDNFFELQIEKSAKEQEFRDSIEEIPEFSKTFEIVNLEKNFSDRTFSIKKKETVKESDENVAYWSLPVLPEIQSDGRRHLKGDSWVVPYTPPSKKLESKKSSNGNVNMKGTTCGNSVVSKSSSVPSLIDINYLLLASKSNISSCSAVSFGSHNAVNFEISSRITKQELTNPVREEESKLEYFECGSSAETNGGIGETVEGYQKNELIILDEVTSDLRKQVLELLKERKALKSNLFEMENRLKENKKMFEKNQEILRQNITAKYEAQLEHLKTEMKQLYNRELAKHKEEQSRINYELEEQNKRYKEHNDELRNQLWDLGEKLLNEQKFKRDLWRNYNDLKKKFENMIWLHGNEIFPRKENFGDESSHVSTVRKLPTAAWSQALKCYISLWRKLALKKKGWEPLVETHNEVPTVPNEDEEEVFDNRFLEDMKTGVCKIERPEGRLMELQYRNSLCLPHLKSSYPAETQFHNPTLFKECDLKYGPLPFGQETQNTSDSDPSMTKSLLPENKGKKKEQTSYKRPGPPTPSKNGGSLFLQQQIGDLRLTPKNVLRELNDPAERNKIASNPLKALFSTKSSKSENFGKKDENTAPVTPRKKHKIFGKPF